MKALAAALLLLPGTWVGPQAERWPAPTSQPAADPLGEYRSGATGGLPASARADKLPVAPNSDASLDEYRSGLIGSKHDFSEVLGTAGTACSGCHVPHMMAIRPATQPAGQPTTLPAPVEIYRIAGQRRVFATDRFTPGPASLVCMACHDGTVATSTMGSGHAMLAGVREGFYVPPDFVWRDHPIGVPYPRNNRKYRPESIVTAEGKVRLPDGYVECVSCHDPHNRTGVRSMLVMSNRRSALCLSCHIK